MATKRILMTGGGSGGHVYPLLAVAEVLRSLDIPGAEIKIYYLGPKDAYRPLFESLDVTCYTLPGAKLRRYASIENIIDIPRFFYALWKAFWRMFALMPDALYSKGGPGALPVVIAAWFYRVPILIHESDMTPGLTNKISSWFAKRIAISFEEAGAKFPSKKVAWTGHPERRSIRTAGQTRDAAKAKLGFMPAEPLVLVMGGSQGSQRLNEAILEAMPILAPVTAVLQQAGPGNAAEVTSLAHAGMLSVDGTLAARHPWKVVPYLTAVGEAILAADLVISRAGSGSIFEIASFGRAAILVPLPEAANDHQRMNAIAFAQAGGGEVIEESNLKPGIIARLAEEILANPEKRQVMEAKSRAFAKDGGAEAIAAELVRL